MGTQASAFRLPGNDTYPHGGAIHCNHTQYPDLTSDHCHCTLRSMIASFKHRGLKRLYERGDRSRIGADLIDKVENILATLDAADTPQALALPGYRLHSLKGSREGFWAVTVRANWRIIFRFENGDAFDVELVDYH